MCFVEQLLDPVEQPLDAAAGLRRDRDQRRPLAQRAARAAGARPRSRRSPIVPLREDDDRRAHAPCARRRRRRDPARRRPRTRRRGRARRRRARRPRARAAPSSTRSPAAAGACAACPRCRRARTSCRRARAPCRSRRASCPGRSETITRSSPSSAFRSDDLPTFGRPRIATRIASSPSRRASPLPGSRVDDLVEQVAGAVPVHARRAGSGRRARAGATRARAVLRRIVDLVREHEHRLVRLRAGSARSPRRRA